ncbi:MAG: HD domain-containing phosphohydrolase [Sphaerochaetaceae bacterium]
MEVKQSLILIVEDQNENIDLLRFILGETYKLMIAKRGEDALKILRLKRPDLIIIDVGLPDMDGFTLYKQITKQLENDEVPIMFITAAVEEKHETVGLELGAVDYIYKPYRPSIIRNRVHNQLELHRYRKGLEEVVKERTLELIETQKGILEALSLATDYRDNETGSHIFRTKNLTRVLAQLLVHIYPEALSAHQIELLVEASQLHDIGKIGIPDALLRKSDKLTDEEFNLMKTHPLVGNELLTKVLERYPDNQFIRAALEVASYHHERWDGSGYPYGLKGEQIPLFARIMAIVDVYDALTSDRVYRQALSHEEALQIMQQSNMGGGSLHFDPTIFEVFVNKQALFKDCLHKGRS